MNHTVMVFLEAKEDFRDELQEALLHICNMSKKEESNLSYHVYRDPDNKEKFALCETFKSKQLHLKQFEKPYIIDFGTKAEKLLASDYVGFFGKEVNLDS